VCDILISQNCVFKLGRFQLEKITFVLLNFLSLQPSNYPEQFQIDLKTVSEVYIDSTHGTNGQNAEFFGIITCENGYGVPVGYMLMEKKSTDDSKLFPGEVIEACTRFFAHARELGLKPTLVHIDKSTAEIAEIKVSTWSCLLICRLQWVGLMRSLC
jgi:hypothetical protein